jgi:hypothetical protein
LRESQDEQFVDVPLQVMHAGLQVKQIKGLFKLISK